MLFFVQMRWNYEGRLTMDQLWDLEAKEIEAARETLKSGMCKVLYKVAGQKRVIGIVDIPSADELDRTVFGRLPMREYLEFEAVWPLREYESFAKDVQTHFKV